MLRVQRKGFIKDVKPGRGVILKRIKPTTYMMKDRGKPGRTPVSNRWAVFKGYSGFKKEYSVEKNADIVQRNMGLRRGISAMVQLANVTTDRETEIKARAVQRLLSARLRASKR